MIHPANESSQIPKHAFNLGSERELPLAVDIRLVFDGPPGIDSPVDTAAIRLQSAARFHELIQKLTSIRLADRSSREDAEGNLC